MSATTIQPIGQLDQLIAGVRAAYNLPNLIHPFGRQQTWKDAPAGAPLDRAGSWTRRSDEYTQEQPAAGRS
jgi:hypothetical protein